jgi:solute carrier family 25 uncoupling protein 8/9
MGSHDHKTKNLYLNILCAGAAGCITEAIAIPFDTIKTRLMVDTTSAVSTKAIFNAVKNLSKDGFPAFFQGLCPGLQRQIVFASIRIGLYEPVILRIRK